ncbi:hypothetical protein [Acidiphilium sp. 20-67-58]|nr:hypothetical protein [Acidiphilium sp. 20-67-58]
MNTDTIHFGNESAHTAGWREQAGEPIRLDRMALYHIDKKSNFIRSDDIHLIG